MAKKKKWIQKAVEEPGALRKTAKRKGLIKDDEPLSKSDIQQLKQSQDPTTRKRAQLAETLGNLKKKKKKTK